MGGAPDSHAGDGPTAPEAEAPTASPSILSVLALVTASPARERLHYFVEAEELRRLLCLMAGTELLTELCQRLLEAR